MHRDNKGMSFIEIIVVVAIMAALLGVTGLGISMISGKPAEECAQKLCSSLQHARTVTMGKNKTSIVLFKDAEDRVAVREVSQRVLDNDGNMEWEERETVVGQEGVAVSCMLADGSQVEITAGNTIELTFDRGSGALKTTQVNGVLADACTRITITKGNRTKYILIVPVTGKVSLTDTP